MVQCQACGGTHVHEGTLNVSRQPGEVQLGGQQFTLNQIRALAPAPVLERPAESGVALPGWAFNLLLQAGIALTALSLLRALAGR
jgi:hypothetical protein